MVLKEYQQKAIDRLNEYITALKEFHGNPKNAFISVYTSEDDKFTYHNSVGDVPFVCIKIPTGGGKTYVACHSIIEIMTNYLEEKLDKGIVLWIVPSDTIKTQTLIKLNDMKDMHRKVLIENFNHIKIFSNEEAKNIKKEDVEENLCIIVSSIDAFRKEKSIRDKYKFYKENGQLMNHFEILTNDKFLEKDDSGVIYSLANVIRKSNPLIIIDEGHRAKTELSFDVIKDLNPSFVIEYTATPHSESNKLVEIHSQELKLAEMVKIPIVLESTREWKKAIDDGFLQRIELEKIADKDENNYIRPIALFQAEPDRKGKDCVTVDKIKQYLIKEKKIKEEEIAIKTSDKNELEGINLFAKNCKIRYIITINALAEGWDCSFAYVLVSVANLGSKIAVEQIIGRIMRMPYAKKRKNDNLNKSYIFASAKNFDEAATQIISGLEENGYSKHDLVKKEDKDKKNPFEADRKFKENIEIPIFSMNNEKLSFGQHLLGNEFKISQQNYRFNFNIPYNQDGIAEIDIEKDEDRWRRGKFRQLTLNLTNREKNCSELELIYWLDKRLRFKEISSVDKLEFLKKVIDYQIKEKKFSLYDLSLNRYPLKEQIDDIINEIMINYAKINFDKFVKEKKIILKVFDKFPEKIEITKGVDVPQDYQRSYYEKIDKLNKEEKGFIDNLDLDDLDNIKFWVRCREKRKDSIALQGWENRNFYPDFVALTKKGNIIALEWKGEHLKGTKDTDYKKELGNIWSSLGKNLYFEMVDNKNMDEVLKKIKEL